ncbi:hypothetical protein INR49_026217 [Caranx melampygus]|nr:hypothetical protein INR49_026217 [Caranx melampygus]
MGKELLLQTNQRQTYSRAFHTEQATKQKKIVAEAPKPPTAVQPPKSAPGMYKGDCTVKNGSIWKSSTSVDKLDVKLTATKMASQRMGMPQKAGPNLFLTWLDMAHKDLHQQPPRWWSEDLLKCPNLLSLAVLLLDSTLLVLLLEPSSNTNQYLLQEHLPGFQTRDPSQDSSGREEGQQASCLKHPQPVQITKETAEEKRAKLAAWQASKARLSRGQP